MQELSLAYAIAVTIIGCIAIIIGIWLFYRGPPTPAVRAFFVIMCFFSASAFWSVGMALTDNYQAALFMGKLVIFCYALEFGFFYEMAIYLVPQDLRPAIGKGKWLFRGELLALGLISGLFMNDVRLLSTGYAVGINIGMVVAVVGGALYVIGAISKLRTYALRSNDEFRKQARLLAAGMIFPFVFGGLLFIPSTILGIKIPLLFSIGFLGTIICLGYAVVRYHLVMVIPVTEANVCAPKSVECIPGLKKGNGYLLESKSSERAYGLLLRELEEGAEGLIITREHPDLVREKFQLTKTPIIWLTTHPGPGRIEPTNLSVLQHSISEFLRKSDKAVLLLDGLEYLMVNDKSDKVVQLCQMIRDEVVVREAVLLICIDPDAYNPRELALLERDLTVIGENLTPKKQINEPATKLKTLPDIAPARQPNI